MNQELRPSGSGTSTLSLRLIAIVTLALASTVSLPAPANSQVAPESTAAPSVTDSLTVKGKRTYWRIDRVRYGSSQRRVVRSRPCIRLKYQRNKTRICLVGRRTARIKHSGFGAAYRVSAKLSTRKRTHRVVISSADLMLRPGTPRASATCDASACPVARTPAKNLGRIKIRTRVLKSCTAKAPWQRSRAALPGKIVALTFDDGPSSYTHDVLAVLKQKGVPATFFTVGSVARYSPDLLRKIRSKGHVLGNHTYNHSLLDLLPTDRIDSELRSANQVIRGATGFTPCVFRAPEGRESARVVDVARSQGLLTVNWNVDPSDWLQPGTSVIVNRVVSSVRAGSIILLHDGGGPRRQTVEALPQIITILRNRGYRFMNLPDMLDLDTRYR